MKGLLRDDVDVMPQELLELGDEPAREPRRQVGPRLDEEIQIARGPRVAPSDGPKNAHIVSAVMPRDPEDSSRRRPISSSIPIVDGLSHPPPHPAPSSRGRGSLAAARSARRD
jgi:hypothetical protein